MHKNIVRIIVTFRSNGQEKVLFLQKSETSKNPRAWELPGGNIEESESIIDAAIRELEEETGIAICEEMAENINFIHIYTFGENKRSKRIVHFVRVELKEMQIIELNRFPDNNHLDAIWLTVDGMNEFFKEEKLAESSNVDYFEIIHRIDGELKVHID